MLVNPSAPFDTLAFPAVRLAKRASRVGLETLAQMAEQEEAGDTRS
jgi:hypothetical protein